MSMARPARCRRSAGADPVQPCVCLSTGEGALTMTVTPADISREWRMLIDGKLVLAEAGATSKTESPATQEVIAEVPEASAGDVDDAVQAARRASQAWRDLSWAKRRDAVLTFARELDRHSDELAAIDA